MISKKFRAKTAFFLKFKNLPLKPPFLKNEKKAQIAPNFFIIR